MKTTLTKIKSIPRIYPKFYQDEEDIYITVSEDENGAIKINKNLGKIEFVDVDEINGEEITSGKLTLEW